jgi:hypothetical protein
MLPSVHLYDHFLFKVHKIHDIATDRFLSPKLRTSYILPPQSGPKKAFGISLLLPELPSEVSSIR